jgi:CRISPR system Cascade subunit CasC
VGRDEVLEVARAMLAIHDGDPGRFPNIPATELEARVAKHRYPETKPGVAKVNSVDVALFGRMTTSDAFEDVEASVQVAHAISTHKLDHEFDFYTAVDDLKSRDEDKGAGMIGDVEFNSSCFYKYFSLDWTSLVGKLGGDAELGRLALRAFARAAVLTTPTGKQNSFAAHNPPDLILVECKESKVPLSYANAFVQPAWPRGEHDLVDVSLKKLFDYVAALDKVYKVKSSRYWLSTRPLAGVSSGSRCDDLAELLDKVAGECKP